jgi:uncharacterized membrane protein
MTRKPSPPQRQTSPKPQAQLIHQQWQGPLPSPVALEQFNQIVPGGAERIFKMVEEEQAHRIKHEQTKLEASAGDFKRGSWMGWTLALTCVGGAIYTAYIGAHPTVSVALVSVPIMGVVLKFLKR